MLEGQIERRLKDRCKQEGMMCMKFVSPGYTGVPDRIILIHGGHVVFVELKAPKKVERTRQRIVQDRIRKMGLEVFSGVDSYDRVEEVIRRCKDLEDRG